MCFVAIIGASVAPKRRPGASQQKERDYFPAARSDGSGRDLLGPEGEDSDENAEEFGL